MEKVLSDLDCETKVVTDGAEVLDCVSRWRPNVILLHTSMPTVDGFEICRRIKGNPATHKIMIVMVGALNDLSEVEHAVEVGTDDFLGTPTSKTELLHRVELLLKLSHLM